MAGSEYGRSILRLRLEHGLKLVDPDAYQNTNLQLSDDTFRICRDAKDLWSDNRSKFSQVSQLFCQQAPLLRSNWVDKPLGDPSTLPDPRHNIESLMMTLFGNLIETQKATYVPNSAASLHISQEEHMLANSGDEDATALPQMSSQSLAVRQIAIPSSSSTYSVPSSSILREMVDATDDLPDINDLTAVGIYGDWNGDDSMAIDPPNVATNIANSAESDAMDISRSYTTRGHREESTSKKRHVSPVHHADKTSKRVVQDDHRVARSTHLDKAVYSFSKPQEDSRSRSTSRSLSRSTSGNASFRSTNTEVNDSFHTNATAPSFGECGQINVLGATSKENLVQTKFMECKQRLINETPFVSQSQAITGTVSFRVLHEAFRVAQHNEFELADVTSHVVKTLKLLGQAEDVDDLDILWKSLGSYTSSRSGTMPMRSSTKAWNSLSLQKNDLQYSKVNFSGTVEFGSTVKQPLLSFKLNPMTFDQSNRLKRKFGSDRIMVWMLPTLEPSDVPPYLKEYAKEFRSAVIDWLTTTDHALLGRVWRAFYVKTKSRKKKSEKNSFGWRVYLFATSGLGFVKRNTTMHNEHEEMNLFRMLEWFISFRTNTKQPILKLFSRLQLSVSDTIPTIPFHIKGEANREKVGTIFLVPDIEVNGVVMNDGCSRISQKAAQLIATKIGILGPPPSAFQGRIAGAKGMWVVEPRLDVHKGCEIWIEISESQQKFETLSRDNPSWSDLDRITFEVHEYSRPLRQAAMNFQLLPILIDRHVGKNIFKDLLRSDLELRTAELESAVSSPQELRAWSQQNSPMGNARLLNNGIRWDGGMPATDSEAINVLAEAGFTPSTCAFLGELCRSEARLYCKNIEEKMNIYPGQTTFAYIIPDFWGVLEVNEIHIGFSNAFTDKRLGSSDIILHDKYVLVARLPAALPSDIHKVLATFKPELSHLKDVIIFPTKGGFCLADKLSGGDYDGDRAWICWNQEIVESFENCEALPKEDYHFYGIEKDMTCVSEIVGPSPEYVVDTEEFVLRGFEFNMRQSLLGRCTNIHETFCYHATNEMHHAPSLDNSKSRSAIGSEKAVYLANLLGYLVDAPKNGYTYGYDQFNNFLKNHISPYKSEPPAYKKDVDAKRSNHIIDQLVLDIAVDGCQKALKKVDLLTKLSPDIIKDSDLTALSSSEAAFAADDRAISLVFDRLKKDLDDLGNAWGRLSAEAKAKKVPWSEAHIRIRDLFLSIPPLSGLHDGIDIDKHPLVKRWRWSFRSSGSLFNNDPWTLLKASTLYSKYTKGNFVWRACGVELMQLKVNANGSGLPISRQMHQYFKFDRKMWDTAKLRAEENEAPDSVDNSTLIEDDEDITSQAFEDAYESQANAE